MPSCNSHSAPTPSNQLASKASASRALPMTHNAHLWNRDYIFDDRGGGRGCFLQYVQCVSTRTGQSVTSVRDHEKGPVERGSAQNSGSNPHTGPIESGAPRGAAVTDSDALRACSDLTRCRASKSGSANRPPESSAELCIHVEVLREQKRRLAW